MYDKEAITNVISEDELFRKFVNGNEDFWLLEKNLEEIQNPSALCELIIYSWICLNAVRLTKLKSWNQKEVECNV